MSILITYQFDDKKAFGQSIVDDLVGTVPLWFCFKLLCSAYFGKTPGTASAWLNLPPEQEREFSEELTRIKEALK